MMNKLVDNCSNRTGSISNIQTNKKVKTNDYVQETQMGLGFVCTGSMYNQLCFGTFSEKR